MKTAYICEGCEEVHKNRDFIFSCLWCHKEICDVCFAKEQTCKECFAIHGEELVHDLYTATYGT